MMRLNRIIFGLTLSFAFGVIGCKKPAGGEGSDVRTLDNLENGSVVTENQCGEDLVLAKSKFDFDSIITQIKVTEKESDELEVKRMVKQALLPVHPVILNQFFGAHLGEIVVGPLDKACDFKKTEDPKSGNTLTADRQKGEDRVIEKGDSGEPLACWRVQEKDAKPVTVDGKEVLGKFKQPTIYISSAKEGGKWTTESIIKHALVREFGYLIPAFLSHYKFVPPHPDAKDKSVNLVLMEVTAADGYFYEKVTNSFKNDLVNRNSKNKDVKIKPFWVFAEGFDSFFCSKKTNKLFRKSFALAYTNFHDVFGEMFFQIYGEKAAEPLKIEKGAEEPVQGAEVEKNEAGASLLLLGQSRYVGYQDPDFQKMQQRRYYGNTGYSDCNRSNQYGNYNYNYDRRRQQLPRGGGGFVQQNSKEYKMVQVQGRLDGLGACQGNYVNRDYYQYGNGGAYRYGTGVNGYAGVATDLFSTVAQLGISMYANQLIQKSTYRPRVTLPRFQNSQTSFGNSNGCRTQNGGGSIGFGGAVTFGAGAAASNYSGSNYSNNTNFDSGNSNSSYGSNSYNSNSSYDSNNNNRNYNSNSNNNYNNNNNYSYRDYNNSRNDYNRAGYNPYSNCSGLFGGGNNNDSNSNYNSSPDYSSNYDTNYNNDSNSGSNYSSYANNDPYSTNNSYNNPTTTPAKKKKKKKSTCGSIFTGTEAGSGNEFGVLLVLFIGLLIPLVSGDRSKFNCDN